MNAKCIRHMYFLVISSFEGSFEGKKKLIIVCKCRMTGCSRMRKMWQEKQTGIYKRKHKGSSEKDSYITS
jgi:hypothetical protein